MRLVGRKDTSLAAALIVGAFILFQQPLHFLLESAGEIERQYHLDLVQALVVLGVVFVFHQYRKRHEAKAEAVAAAAEAHQERLRSAELERLVGLSRALASATDFTTVNHALGRYLPKFTRDRAVWMLICQQGCWDVLLRDVDDRRTAEQLEAVAERALALDRVRTMDASCVRLDDVVCFPMLVGSRPIGMIEVLDRPSLSTQECSALEAAASMVAIAVRNVQILVETRETSLRDGLTGCFNRAHAMETLGMELRRARRRALPLSMVMFDVDGFKQVNDSYGHLAGDHLLAEIGRRLGDVLRTTDVKCRYGGDEFLLILPDTPAGGARHVAESIREQISNIVVPVGEAQVKVTISVGTATARADERDVQAFIGRADRALYQAKKTGRNRVSGGDLESIGPLRLVAAAH